MSDVNTPEPRNYERYAWPGGYERFAVMTDGGILCIPCCNNPENPIHFGDDMEDGWRVAAFDSMANSDETHNCDHCSREIS